MIIMPYLHFCINACLHQVGSRLGWQQIFHNTHTSLIVICKCSLHCAHLLPCTCWEGLVDHPHHCSSSLVTNAHPRWTWTQSNAGSAAGTHAILVVMSHHCVRWLQFCALRGGLMILKRDMVSSTIPLWCPPPSSSSCQCQFYWDQDMGYQQGPVPMQISLPA